jgi:hypothetical protein
MVQRVSVNNNLRTKRAILQNIYNVGLKSPKNGGSGRNFACRALVNVRLVGKTSGKNTAHGCLWVKKMHFLELFTMLMQVYRSIATDLPGFLLVDYQGKNSSCNLQGFHDS